MSSSQETHGDSGGPVEKTAIVADDTKLRSSRRPEGIVVEVIGGPMDGTRRSARADALNIGRAEENHLHLHCDSSVSARHARVVIEGGQYWLEDLGSTNGTFLNGDLVNRVTELALRDGDVLTLGGQGSVKFIFRKL